MLVGTGLVISTADGLRAELTSKHIYAINHCEMHCSDSSNLLLLGLQTCSPQPTGYPGRFPAWIPGRRCMLTDRQPSSGYKCRDRNAGVSPSGVVPARGMSTIPTGNLRSGGTRPGLGGMSFLTHTRRPLAAWPTSLGGYLDLALSLVRIPSTVVNSLRLTTSL